MIVGDHSNIKLFRNENRRIWNQAQANNLAIKNCESDVILRLDIDHFIKSEDFDKFLNLSNNMKDKTIYQFQRFRIDTNEFINKVCNIILINKRDFYDIGQYDERFKIIHRNI